MALAVSSTTGCFSSPLPSGRPSSSLLRYRSIFLQHPGSSRTRKRSGIGLMDSGGEADCASKLYFGWGSFQSPPSSSSSVVRASTNSALGVSDVDLKADDISTLELPPLPDKQVERLKSRNARCARSGALSPEALAKYSTNSTETDRGAQELSISISRRQGLLMSAVVPLLLTLQGFGVLPSARAAEEDALRLEKIRSEVTKLVSKGKAAGVLRLVFHDAGTFNLGTKQGGMNGSVIYELDRPESAGLKRSVRVLEKVKTALEPEFAVSWADLIAVAGAESVAICGGPNINVKLGRLDTSSPDPEGQMPEETLSATELKKKFQQKGFSTQELVALSGAHTIGNKGFGAPDLFDNTYYKILTQKPWRDSQGTDMSTSMVGLPSDRNLTDDSECMKWVKFYAEDENKFFLDFSRAYLKLVNTGAQWA